MSNSKRRTRKKTVSNQEITSISLPKPLYRDVKMLIEDEYEGNLSRYVRTLIRGDLKKKAA